MYNSNRIYITQELDLKINKLRQAFPKSLKKKKKLLLRLEFKEKHNFRYSKKLNVAPLEIGKKINKKIFFLNLKEKFW